jgi:hypothetical protein
LNPQDLLRPTLQERDPATPGTRTALLRDMADNRDQDREQDPAVAGGGDAQGDGDNEAATLGTALSEGGRALSVDPSPEGALMHMGTVTTSEPAPLPPDMDRDATFDAIDDREADAARMEVRRREHSAD